VHLRDKNRHAPVVGQGYVHALRLLVGGASATARYEWDLETWTEKAEQASRVYSKSCWKFIVVYCTIMQASKHHLHGFCISTTPLHGD
jgi:hypothetical protein